MEADRVIQLLEHHILIKIDSKERENRELSVNHELVKIKNKEVISELKEVLGYLNWLRKS